jgi:hypothetical protein
MKTLKISVLCVFAACMIVSQTAPRAFSQEYETPPTLQAATLLPKALLSGPDYRVDGTVTNDGYLNTYLLRSRFGDFTVVSTALLRTRIDEVKAMAAMEQVNSSGQFGSALVDKGAQTVQGAANLVTRPVETMGSALSGVGKMFARAQESLAESTPSKYEDDRLKKISGFSQTKRDYAKQFGIDPYSTNAVLQEKLNSLASAGFAGSITGSALQALIPGGVGIAVGAVSGSTMLGTIDASIPPEDMRRQNRQMLTDMGVSSSMTRLFIDNEVFTPLQQTIIVKSLNAMPDVREKETFVSFLVRTDNQDLALFRQRMSQMYAGYAKGVAPLSSFTALGRFVGAVKSDGSLVLAFPLDYLVWTSTNAAIIRALSETAKSSSIPGVELWLTGKASPMTIKELRRLGWKLHENSSQQLLGI